MRDADEVGAFVDGILRRIVDPPREVTRAEKLAEARARARAREEARSASERRAKETAAVPETPPTPEHPSRALDASARDERWWTSVDASAREISADDPSPRHLHLEHRPEDARPDRATRRAASTQDRCRRDDDDEVVVRRARQARVARRRHARLRARARASRRRRRRRATAKTSRARAGRGVPPVAPAETRAFVESADTRPSPPRTFAKPPLAKRRREHRPRGSSNPTARVRRRHRRGPTSGDVASRAAPRGVREARVGGGGDGSAKTSPRCRDAETCGARNVCAAVDATRPFQRGAAPPARERIGEGARRKTVTRTAAPAARARAVRAMRTRVVRARDADRTDDARVALAPSPLVTLTCPASLSIAQVLRRGVRGGGLGDAPTRVRGDVARVRAPGTHRGDESTRRTRSADASLRFMTTSIARGS